LLPCYYQLLALIFVSIEMVTLEHSPVTASKEVLGGMLVFRGTRVPVQTLLDYLNDGYTPDDFMEFFPSVKKEEVEAFLRLIESNVDSLAAIRS